MKVVRKFAGQTLSFALGFFALSGWTGQQRAAAQAPYLLPYTIQIVAGGGTAPAVGATCVGSNGVVGTAYDTLGDGCPITSGSVVVGASTDIHDVGVDAQGNIFFIDNQGAGFVRRIDARSGIVTAYVGSAASAQPTSACAAVIDKYGDGCTANDGKGNVPVSGSTYVYSANLAKDRGLGVTRNGDVYLAGYNSNVVQRVSLATGLLTLVAASEAGGTTAKPSGNTGQAGYTNDGSLATNAKVNAPRGVTADAAGNVYIADSANNVIRKVTAATGIISTVVSASPGGGAAATAGSSGDGGPATSALLSAPEDVEVDSFGNIYIADFGNSKVRMVYEGGTTAATLIAKTNAGVTPVVGNIYTIMGGGTGTYTPGTIVLATSVPVTQTRKIALDSRGNVYLADNGNNVVWFLDATTGYMRVIAGTVGKTSGGAGCTGQADTLGDNCVGTNATLSAASAMGVGVDALGNVLISDSGDKLLRRVNTNQAFPLTAAGKAVSEVMQIHFAAGDSPAAANAYVLTGSSDFAVSGTPSCSTNADSTQDCLVTVTFTPTRPGVEVANLTVTSTVNGPSLIGISGTGTAASVALDPGTTSALATGLKTPQAIAQDGAGNIYIADTGNNRVVRYAATGGMTILAGTGTAGYTGDNGLATAAQLSGPKSVAVARSGAVYVADTGNNVIRRIDPSTGLITTYGGGAAAVCSSAVDTFGDGCPATSASFSAPAGLAMDIDGNVYVSDTGHNLIRELTVGGYAVYIGGGASAICGTGDVFGSGCPASGAVFNAPTGLALDSNRNLFIADTGDNELREITNRGNVVLIAGTGVSGASGNGGAATGAQLAGPTGVAVDGAANVYIADTGNAVIREVNALGIINTTVGILGASGTGTLPGSAFAVQLSAPAGVASTGQGRLTVLDSGNSRAFVDDRGSVTYNFGRTNLTFSSPTLQIQETSTGSIAATLGTPLFATSGSTGSFTLAGSGSGGCSASQTLASGNSCLLTAQFTPLGLGAVSATYTEASTNTINVPVPFITLSGTGAVLTQTTSATLVTTPASGSPTYAVPFVVTTTITPASCNTAAPSCFPTGTVSFFVDGTQVGLPVTVGATGAASQTISGLSVGSHTIVAVYNGDSFYASSSAPTLKVSIAQGVTVTVVTASPATSPQFATLTLSASVTGPVATSFPTGTINFYAGTVLVGTASINATTGVATITSASSSFGLPAAVYSLTAVYSGDNNYATSTSAPKTLTISPDAQSFAVSLNPAITGTAQGSTGQTLATITPSNTLNGTVTFACSGMPANSDCTFQPTSLTFNPVAGAASPQQMQITLFTDVPSSVLPSASLSRPHLFGSKGGNVALAGFVGWPLLLTSLVGIFGFRKRMRRFGLLAVLALFGALAGASLTLSGCGSGNSVSAPGSNLTPVGVYNVTLTLTGPSGTTPVTTPITFTVTAGIPGQL